MKTYFEKFLDKPFWYRTIVYFIFLILLWLILDWKNNGTLNLSIIYVDRVLTFLFIGFAILLAWAQKGIYNSIFGRLI